MYCFPRCCSPRRCCRSFFRLHALPIRSGSRGSQTRLAWGGLPEPFDSKSPGPLPDFCLGGPLHALPAFILLDGVLRVRLIRASTECGAETYHSPAPASLNRIPWGSRVGTGFACGPRARGYPLPDGKAGHFLPPRPPPEQRGPKPGVPGPGGGPPAPRAPHPGPHAPLPPQPDR